MRRLPPLNAVRAFEAAARHLSFTRAGEELGVTHGAVSRQVRQLEEFLGAALFERKTRQIVLTAAGARFSLRGRRLPWPISRLPPRRSPVARPAWCASTCGRVSRCDG
ncbi:LysR family transcriptional regulator [uncultured Pigmentiphaga sp.]|uniref:LysR family transcriptional regulator n=1 Tax=uncultured Pigmentiphaga sp. TaxID=340361 RepID=UPI0034175D66